jgi:hypothetical protein
VFLRANLVRLANPGSEFRVNLGGRFEAEVMDMVSRRDRFDTAEPWTWQAAREHDMAINPSFARGDLSE